MKENTIENVPVGEDPEWLKKMKEEKPLNIYQRMSAVMGDVGYIQKDKIVKNKHGAEMYRVTSHDTVVRMTRDHFLKHGILVVPRITKHERIGSNLTVADMEIEYVNIDNPEDKITSASFGYGIDSGDKGPGKAISYAFRYGLLKGLLLETGDDPENENEDFKEELIDEEQYITLREICESKNFPIDGTLQAMAKKIFEVKSIREITKTQFELAKKELLDKPANQPK
jgi:hypothetical protein